eukprot:CAMPEP_0175019790 /NCGR_PEP_ID=MMETSP0005-20121125/13764_1 /TAXON_ID=420556 /ORGANISM="Ochromonas sp., Strain CCMP1393" /LENGTH=80 /DNA_ID=CAMNT_0016277585 /DNA_START=114 /DNA_END=352 /DNA_ORIENTATION=+
MDNKLDQMLKLRQIPKTATTATAGGSNISVRTSGEETCNSFSALCSSSSAFAGSAVEATTLPELMDKGKSSSSSSSSSSS